MRYIDADALVELLYKRYCIPCIKYEHSRSRCVICKINLYLDIVAEAPTAEVAEVRHGKWTLHTDGSGTCSECGTTQKNVWDCDRWQNYCGHCGARMDGDEE